MENGNRQPGDASLPAHSGGEPLQYQRIALVDLLDRLLAGGVVISGEVRLAIADVDLVTVSLRALIASVSSAVAHGPEKEEGRAAYDP
jgi:Gas vesicle protein